MGSRPIGEAGSGTTILPVLGSNVLRLNRILLLLVNKYFVATAGSLAIAFRRGHMYTQWPRQNAIPSVELCRDCVKIAFHNTDTDILARGPHEDRREDVGVSGELARSACLQE